MCDRLSFGFHNPNHAAALACALLPLCWGWRRGVWLGRIIAATLFIAIVLTQSRTGLIVAALEWAAWWAMRRENCGFQILDFRRRMGFRSERTVLRSRSLALLGKLAVAAIALGLSLWWLWPRLSLDGSILNRPKIWLAGLRLFAANHDGVGLGNSGALVSAFLLPDAVPDVRTLISSHLTLLAEFGWLAAWAWTAFVMLALSGLRQRPRLGIAFAGLVLSAFVSTVFDWSVLFDFSAQGGLGWTNWALSWMTFAMFIAIGIRILLATATMRRVVCASVFSALLACSLLLVPHGDVLRIENGYAMSGEAPRTLVLYDETRPLRSVRHLLGGRFVAPVRGVSRFPNDIDWTAIESVVLLGGCREWNYLIEERGVAVSCPDE